LAAPRVAILIPAYNEETTIAGVVRGASEFGKVFVSDDGSTDATAKLAHDCGATVLNQGSNQGYDSALAFGLSELSHEGFDFVITMDADGQHAFEDLVLFENALTSGSFVVVGKRPRKARLMEKIFGLYTQIIWGVADPLCGMKGYRTSILREKQRIKTYDSIGTEVLLFALMNGHHVESVPISGKERVGKPRFAGVLKANFLIGRALVLAVALALKSFFLRTSNLPRTRAR
jgi:glycosyltransferase involved in cell wall biosynthesis